MLHSRDNFLLILSHIDLKQYSREFQLLVGYIKGYYERDDNARRVDRELFGHLIEAEVNNEKHTTRFLNIVDEALALDVSETNVKQVILLAKKNELGIALASAIANNKDHDHLVEEYRELLKLTELEELTEKGVEVYEFDSLADLISHEVDPTTRLKVYPERLGEDLEGGLRGSDHLTLMARPEMGKTGLILTMARGFAMHGHRGIIFNNEERIERLRMRALSCFTGMTAAEIKANPQAAMDIAEQMGYQNITFIGLSPGTLRQIEDFVEKYEVKWFVVDQLRNLFMKSENRTNQLEQAAQGIRNIAKKYNAVAISVTQAGDSAEGKAVLTMGDVDSSNTGIPGACDVLLGVGATAEQKEQGIRTLSLCKNKIGGIHSEFPVRFNPFISKYMSISKK